MSPREIEDFVKRWPALERRLHRALFAMRVPESIRDDVVQESAIRLMSMWARLDPCLPVWPLLRTIAVRVVADHSRARREVPTDEVPDSATADAATAALARMKTSDLWEGVARLSPKERAAVLSGVTASAEPRARESSATKMARLRGRRRLTRYLEQTGWGLASVGEFVRRPWLRATSRWNSVQWEVALRDLLPAGLAALHIAVGATLVVSDVEARTPAQRIALRRAEEGAGAAPTRAAAARAEARRDARPERDERAIPSQQPYVPPASKAEPRGHPAGAFEGGAQANAAGRGARVEQRERGVFVVVCTGQQNGTSAEPCNHRRDDAAVVWVGTP